LIAAVSTLPTGPESQEVVAVGVNVETTSPHISQAIYCERE